MAKLGTIEDYEKLMSVEDEVKETNEQAKKVADSMKEDGTYHAELEAIVMGSTLRNVRAMCMKRFDDLASVLCPSAPDLLTSVMEDCFDSGYAAAINTVDGNRELMLDAARNQDKAGVERFVANSRRISEQCGLLALLRIAKAKSERAGAEFTKEDADKVYESVKDDFPHTSIDDVSFF